MVGNEIVFFDMDLMAFLRIAMIRLVNAVVQCVSNPGCQYPDARSKTQGLFMTSCMLPPLQFVSYELGKLLPEALHPWPIDLVRVNDTRSDIVPNSGASHILDFHLMHVSWGREGAPGGHESEAFILVLVSSALT